MGTAYFYEDILKQDQADYEIEETEVELEYSRIQRAIRCVLRDLTRSADRVVEELDEEVAGIFHAQQSILENAPLLEEMRNELEQEMVNAEEVVKGVFRRWERKLSKRTAHMPSFPDHDVADIGRMILHSLRGMHTHSLEDVPEGSVLVARRLLPSDTVHLSRKSVVAVVVAFAGPGSHAALLTRELGIPAVAQIPDVLHEVSAGELLLVDGSSGTVVVAPDDETTASFCQRLKQQQSSADEARQLCHQAAKTEEGTYVEITANIGCREDAVLAAENGADGVGLYRLESVLLSRKVFPSEAELLTEMRNTLATFGGQTSTLRLLDVGGDKSVPGLDLPAESNPFLGRRGVRLLLEYPDLLKTQLRVFLQLAQERDVRILVPMVTLAEEMTRIRDVAEDIAAELGMRKLPPVGAMIETPAAALCLDTITPHADFLSVGTNDLTQYTMVVGRENPLVEHYFQDDHPAVLRLLELICEDAGDTPVSVCGELASRTSGLQTLLDLGIRSLSVAPPLVPELKHAVRRACVSPRTRKHYGETIPTK